MGNVYKPKIRLVLDFALLLTVPFLPSGKPFFFLRASNPDRHDLWRMSCEILPSRIKDLGVIRKELQPFVWDVV